MIPALYILGALVVTGVLLKILDRQNRPGKDASSQEESPAEAPQEECCGMHITCEKDSLLTAVDPEAHYYDDEELDAFRGRGADEYDDSEIEEFREVLLTLRPEEIAPWARSIQVRGIELPGCVRDELLMIVAEARAAKTHKTDV